MTGYQSNSELEHYSFPFVPFVGSYNDRPNIVPGYTNLRIMSKVTRVTFDGAGTEKFTPKFTGILDAVTVNDNLFEEGEMFFVKTDSFTCGSFGGTALITHAYGKQMFYDEFTRLFISLTGVSGHGLGPGENVTIERKDGKMIKTLSYRELVIQGRKDGSPFETEVTFEKDEIIV